MCACFRLAGNLVLEPDWSCEACTGGARQDAKERARAKMVVAGRPTVKHGSEVCVRTCDDAAQSGRSHHH
jgi:hypothetical protein